MTSVFWPFTPNCSRFLDFIFIIFCEEKQTMSDALNRFTSIVRKGVDEYAMIQDGDKVAVGVSGGKDSMLLLRSLRHLQIYYPKRFELMALTIEMGFEGMDFEPVQQLCDDIGVEYVRIKTDIKEVVFDVRQEENPCSLCSKMRRGAINTAMKEHGCNKLALGHHWDDAVETFLMSLMFEGRISCFKPVTYMSRADVWQIRPMIYAQEAKVAAVVQELGLPIVENPCPADNDSKRYEIKQLIARLEKDFPDLRSKIFGSMQRLPLEGWAPGKRI